MSYALDIRIDGVEDMVRAYARLSDAAARAVVSSVREGVKAGEREGKTVHRWETRTGKTEAGIMGTVTGATPGSATGEIVSLAKHSSYLEKGTRGHWITPKKRRDRGKRRAYLRFEWHGEIVFRRRVWHPGTQPSPFMGPAYFKCERVMLASLERALAAAQVFFD